MVMQSQHLGVHLARRPHTDHEALKKAISEIFPECRVCKGTDIRPRVELEDQTFFEPGNPIGNPIKVQAEKRETIKELYCEDCGVTYFNSKVAGLSFNLRMGTFNR